MGFLFLGRIPPLPPPPPPFPPPPPSSSAAASSYHACYHRTHNTHSSLELTLITQHACATALVSLTQYVCTTTHFTPHYNTPHPYACYHFTHSSLELTLITQHACTTTLLHSLNMYALQHIHPTLQHPTLQHIKLHTPHHNTSSYTDPSSSQEYRQHGLPFFSLLLFGLCWPSERSKGVRYRNLWLVEQRDLAKQSRLRHHHHWRSMCLLSRAAHIMHTLPENNDEALLCFGNSMALGY